MNLERLYVKTDRIMQNMYNFENVLFHRMLALDLTMAENTLLEFAPVILIRIEFEKCNSSGCRANTLIPVQRLISVQKNPYVK